MKAKSKLDSVFDYLSPHILSAVLNIPKTELDSLREIRLRLGRKLTVTAGAKEYYLRSCGSLSLSPQNAVDVSVQDIEYTYTRALKSSFHSFAREITAGYVTISGGSRIGFCGIAVLDPKNSYCVENVKDISCINIRISREITGCADELFNAYFAGAPQSLLIAGPPSSGKTTLLRDLTRQLGDKSTVSLIDERNEIASVFAAKPQNDVGAKTDVFTSYNRFEGIMTAVRVMSPIYLVCDEIGSREDLRALEYAVNSGVRLVATCHGACIKDVCRKPVIKKLLKLGAFDSIVLLGTGKSCGRVIDTARLNKTAEAALC